MAQSLNSLAVGALVKDTGTLYNGKPIIWKIADKGHTGYPSGAVTLITERIISLPFYHFDVYRIGDIEEMDEIGYEDYFYGEGVCLIEWADLIREILPEQMCRVTIEKDLEKGFDYRKITLEGFKGIEEQEA